MRSIFTNIIAGLLILTPPALAYEPLTQEQCTPIDLRGETCPDGTPRLPPLRSQGMTNYCFAYTTTEVLSYATCRHLSALSSGLLVNMDSSAPLKDPANPINLGGNPRDLVQILGAAGRGPCLESAFPSSPSPILSENQPKNDPHNTPGLDFLMGFYNRRESPNPLGCARQDISQVSLNPPLVSDGESVTNTQLQQALTTALEVNRAPAIVHVNSNLVFDNKPVSPVRPDTVGTNHYINIVGRAWRTDADGVGHCYYMYRDQYPMDRSLWPRAEAHPSEAVTALPQSQYYYIWVQEENLLNNADDVIYAD